MGETVRLIIASSQVEAEIICSLLRTEGIVCGHRKTDMAAAWYGDPWAGPREILVDENDVVEARRLLTLHDPPVPPSAGNV